MSRPSRVRGHPAAGARLGAGRRPPRAGRPDPATRRGWVPSVTKRLGANGKLPKVPGGTKRPSTPPPAAYRADGALIDAGRTYLSAPALAERAQWLVDDSPRQALAAMGLYALLASGWSAWRSGGRIRASAREIAEATGSGQRSVTRSLRLLVRAGLVTSDEEGLRLVRRFLPRAQKGWLEKGARALELVHRDTWSIRQRLAERDDVQPYHLLRDLGAHIVQLVAEEAGVSIVAAFDRRTMRRRAARLVRAKLRVLAFRLRARRLAEPAPDEVAGGPPPGGFRAWREGLAVRPHAPPSVV